LSMYLKESETTEISQMLLDWRKSMKKRLIIIGASGHGKVVADIAQKMKIWDKIEFLDDNEEIKMALNLRVVGKSTDIAKYIHDSDVFVAIGGNSTREKVFNQLESIGATIPTLIHPTSIIGPDVNIGLGTVIMAGVVINCCTTIGKGCIINTSSAIDHDNVIGDFVHVSPGASLAGTVNVGRLTWIGIGAIVINNISIVQDCIIGAGAVVVNDINACGIYIGVPAKEK
jgi:sugar O-acyltransferase (sialic acid O-acetyltransferase NeuD family)